MAAHVIAIVAGTLLIAVNLIDATGTLVATQGRTAWWRPTRIFYRLSWPFWRAVALRIPGAERRERFLSGYGPLSLLALLLIWLVGLLFGWSLIYLGMASSFRNAPDYASLVYYSGTSMLTLGFGDITAVDTTTRYLTLVEALTGLGTVALLISYLPAMYGAYSRRESRLLTLDDPSGYRITPAAVIILHAPDGDLRRLYDFFAAWELWTAEVLESHVSYPMLSFFRSQHAGQSWLTALGVVLDAATLTCAVIPGADRREPYFMYRRGRRALNEISSRLHVPAPANPEAGVDRERMSIGYGVLAAADLVQRDIDDAWERLRSMRADYGSQLEALIVFLAAPRGFWGHSAESFEEPPALRTPDPAAPH